MTEKELGAQRVPGYLAPWQTELDETLQKKIGWQSNVLILKLACVTAASQSNTVL